MGQLATNEWVHERGGSSNKRKLGDELGLCERSMPASLKTTSWTWILKFTTRHFAHVLASMRKRAETAWLSYRVIFTHTSFKDMAPVDRVHLFVATGAACLGCQGPKFERKFPLIRQCALCGLLHPALEGRYICISLHRRTKSRYIACNFGISNA